MIWLLYYAELMSFLGGALLLGMALRNIARGTASRNWPETSGTILRTFVSVQTDSEGAKGYTPSIEYEYIVEGSRQKGTRLQYGQVGSWSREHAERTIAAYAAGASVRVLLIPEIRKILCCFPVLPGAIFFLRWRALSFWAPVSCCEVADLTGYRFVSG
jgi:hypothetical protein